MTIAFKVLGYTLASVEVDLSAIAGAEGPPVVVVGDRMARRFTRSMSGWWTRKAFER